MSKRSASSVRAGRVAASARRTRRNLDLSDIPEASDAQPAPSPTPARKAANRDENFLSDRSDRRAITPEDLTAFGRKGEVFRDFARAYTTDDLELAPVFRDEIVSAAPAGVRDQVAECAAVVLDSRPALPAAAIYGRIDGLRSVVLGFAWSKTDGGPLDRFMIWGWSPGSCETPSLYLAGRIRT